MRISRITQFYFLITVLVLASSFTEEGRGILYSGPLVRNSEFPLQIKVVIGERIRIQVDGENAILSIYTINPYNGNSTNTFNMTNKEFEELYFTISNILTIRLISKTPIQLTVSRIGLSLEFKCKLIASLTFLISAGIIEYIGKRKKWSFPIFSDEIRGISPYIMVGTLLVIGYIDAKNGAIVLSYGFSTDYRNAVEIMHIFVYEATINSFGNIVIFSILALYLNRTIFGRLFYKIYPINSINVYMSRIITFALLTLPLVINSFFSMSFGRGTLLSSFDELFIVYLPPAMMGYFAVFMIFIFSILIDDIFQNKFVTLTFPMSILLLSQMNFLNFYPFSIFRTLTSYDDSTGYRHVPLLSEILLVVLISIISSILLNMFYRKSRWFREH